MFVYRGWSYKILFLKLDVEINSVYLHINQTIGFELLLNRDCQPDIWQIGGFTNEFSAAHNNSVCLANFIGKDTGSLC
jgi:hypothetical protein